jgi:polyisoprenoid-binding protein YceI
MTYIPGRRAMRTALIFLLIFIYAVLVPPVGAQDAYVLTPESRLRIEGTSTIDTFTCEAETILGSGHLQGSHGVAGEKSRIGSEEARVELIVPVESFDCGKARMNRDMYEALKASSHPEIGFLLDGVEVVDSNSDGEYNLRATGRLSLAGEERQVTLSVRSTTFPDGRLRAAGAVDLLMSDFGITPPKALLGLVRARDQITVAFELFGVREAVAQAYR